MDIAPPKNLGGLVMANPLGKIPMILPLALALWLALAAGAGALDIPARADCAAIHIDTSAGPGLTVFPDGSGHLTIGALLPHARFERGTLDFAQIHAHLQPQVVETIRNAEQPSVLVTFARTGEAAAPGYYIYDDAFIATLFRQAEQQSFRDHDGANAAND